MATLKYIGPRLSTGEPERSLNYDGIPAGDVEEDELTKEQVKLALHSGLYAREGEVRETKAKLAGKPRKPKIVAPKPPPAIEPPIVEPPFDSSVDVPPAEPGQEE